MTIPIRPAPEGSVYEHRLEVAALQVMLRDQLADGPDRPQVLWTDAESTALVSTGKVRLALQSGLVLVDVPMTTDQTDTKSLVVALRVGASVSDATLAAVTEETPRGDALLAARWGAIVQDAVWLALLQVGQAELAKRRSPALQLSGLFSEKGAFVYIFTERVTLETIRTYFARQPELVVIRPPGRPPPALPPLIRPHLPLPPISPIPPIIR